MDVFSAGVGLAAFPLFWYDFRIRIFKVGEVTVFIILKVTIGIVIVIAGIRFPVDRISCP